jgi:hypothetical protein
VSTDYEGLGGPGSHPMLIGVSEGRSMLDAAAPPARSPAATASPLLIFQLRQLSASPRWGRTTHR